jgi:hypothetical protein
MSETKKPRAMSAKRFATAKVSAKTTVEGFLAGHRQFLNQHSFLYPILDAYDKKDLLPSVALTTIQSALMSHFLEMETKKAKARMEEAEEEEESVSSNYTVSLFVKVLDKEGQLTIQVGQVETRKLQEKTNPNTGKIYLEPYTESKPAVWQVADFGMAMQMADRKLFQREDSVYATIVNNFDRPITTSIQRGDAIARVLRVKKGPASRTRGMSTKSLGFTPHVSQTRVTGPWSNRTR